MMRIFIPILLVIVACSQPKFYYKSQNHQSMNFYDSLLSTANNNATPIDSIRVYEAWLYEALALRNSVGEQTMQNIFSTKPFENYPGSLRSYRLYCFMLYRMDKAKKKAINNEVIFMHTSFEGNCYEGEDDGSPEEFVDSACANVGIGPAYYGEIRTNQMVFTRSIPMNKYRKSYKPTKTSLENMRMVTDVPMLSSRTDLFTIKEIIVLSDNKIGGSKPLYYDIYKTFGDSAALTFEYSTTLKRPMNKQ